MHDHPGDEEEHEKPAYPIDERTNGKTFYPPNQAAEGIMERVRGDRKHKSTDDCNKLDQGVAVHSRDSQTDSRESRIEWVLPSNQYYADENQLP